ncbi:hypothetical protein [Planomonospora parontospora]|uniref:hypothetical protein n=1 Tax=Planomonospora parontospora TaxID=58119 RepID=UPI0016700F26|nr:hypothetical protein [Planomonospora parontospora]GGL38091.1 hypothetical protein GCM10014719_44040 [Planomonospora parontospora subsp. antibiotica]
MEMAITYRFGPRRLMWRRWTLVCPGPCGVAFLDCHATMVMFSNSIGVSMSRLLCRRKTGGAPGTIARVADQLGVYRKALRG